MSLQRFTFVHIPKTAGTSFNHLVMSNYPLEQVFYWRYDRDMLQEMERFVKQDREYGVKVITGHMGMGIHQHLAPDYPYFTILRNPIKRVISQYYFFHSLRPEKFTWEEFCFHRQNLMTRYLSGLELKQQIELTSCQKLNRFRRRNLPELLSYQECPNELLKVAKENLDKCLLFGITEKMTETLLLCKTHFSWNCIYQTRKNKARKKTPPQLDNQTLAIIEKYNQLDLQLYQYALEKFECLVANQDENFVRELEYWHQNKIGRTGEALQSTKIFCKRLYSRGKREFKKILLRQEDVLS